jgi:hypothetical protein
VVQNTRTKGKNLIDVRLVYGQIKFVKTQTQSIASFDALPGKKFLGA